MAMVPLGPKSTLNGNVNVNVSNPYDLKSKANTGRSGPSAGAPPPSAAAAGSPDAAAATATAAAATATAAIRTDRLAMGGPPQGY